MKVTCTELASHADVLRGSSSNYDAKNDLICKKPLHGVRMGVARSSLWVPVACVAGGIHV